MLHLIGLGRRAPGKETHLGEHSGRRMESSQENYAGEVTKKGAPDDWVPEKGNLKRATVGFRGDCGSQNRASQDLLSFDCNSLRG